MSQEAGLHAKGCERHDRYGHLTPWGYGGREGGGHRTLRNSDGVTSAAATRWGLADGGGSMDARLRQGQGQRRLGHMTSPWGEWEQRRARSVVGPAAQRHQWEQRRRRWMSCRWCEGRNGGDDAQNKEVRWGVAIGLLTPMPKMMG